MEKSRTTPPQAVSGASVPLDPEAFAALFVRSYKRFWLVAAAITGDRTHADDVVQDAALVALGKLDQFVVGTNFNAWMSEIVRRSALNVARKAQNRSTTPVDPTQLDRSNPGSATPTCEDGLALHSTGALPEHQIDFDDDVMKALRQVSEVARACILLRIVQNLSYAEIAEILQIPKGTAMSHVHRTKRVLREQLKNPFAKKLRDSEASS